LEDFVVYYGALLRYLLVRLDTLFLGIDADPLYVFLEATCVSSVLQLTFLYYQGIWTLVLQCIQCMHQVFVKFLFFLIVSCTKGFQLVYAIQFGPALLTQCARSKKVPKDALVAPLFLKLSELLLL
jgi:hypothetical protein